MALPSLTLRNTKGSALTFSEMDTNLTNLQQANVTVTAGGTTTNIALNSGITLTAGNNITITNSLGNITINSTASGGGGSNYGDSNVAAYLPTYNGTIGALTTANTAMRSYVDGQILAANAGVTSANLGMKGYVDSVAGGGSSYGNANVALYLPSYSGNIANIRLGNSGVLTFADGTTQTTAASGGGGGGSSYGNANVAQYLPTYAGNLTVGSGYQSTAYTNGALVVTGGMGISGNIRQLGRMLAGDAINHANIANVWVAASTTNPKQDRAINLIGGLAGIKIARINSVPSVDLQAWNTNISTLNAFWGISMNGSTYAFELTDRTGSSGTAANVRLNISRSTSSQAVATFVNSDLVVQGNISGSIAANATITGNLVSLNYGHTFDDTLVGYRGMPQKLLSADYSTVQSDMGRHFLANSSVTTDITVTLISNMGPLGDNYPIGTVMTFVNQGSANIIITADTFGSTQLAGTGDTGNRTVSPMGMATVLKLGPYNNWIVTGVGVT